MRLKYIELQGFKSFPDKTVITFGEGITAIVGPNGSGKSNIADAVRWVMGETSSKTLRGQKMEDVIFDGTAMRKPLGFAEVSLVLDNSDRTLAIEYDEVAITRRYYRSGDSEYFINRSDVRLRDIQELLRDTGLGKTGYSIIGQGAITEIIAAKSADRRALFEEAAGISGFKHKKEESLRNLANTNDNILRINDITSELEGRLGPLEKQAQKAKKYLALRDERRGLEITLWVNRIDAIKEILVSAEKQTAELRESYGKTEADIRNADDSISDFTEKCEKLTAEIESLRAMGREKDEITAGKRSQILLADNDIAHAKKDTERLKSEIAASSENSEKFDAEKKQCNDEIEEILRALAKNGDEINNIAAEAENITDRQKNLRGESEALSAALAEADTALTILKVRMGSLEQSAQNRSEYIKERGLEIEDAKQRLAVLEHERADTAVALEETEKSISENNNVRSGYEVKLRNVGAKRNELNSEMSRLNLELGNHRNRLQILSDMEKHYDGFRDSVKTVMQDAARGVLKGIEGTVADLIEVEDEYSTAVETALGGALQHIVTLDEKSAKNGIYYLKNQNKGRATFLPITSMTGELLRTDELENEYGFVGAAVDLIRYDKKYESVMVALLGKVAVCEDLDCAVAVARKNHYSFKVVTLDGQVVNTGGSFTGGSATKNFGILSRHNEIEALEKQCEEDEKKIEKAADGLHSVDGEYNALSASLEAVEAESRELEKRVVGLRADLNHFTEYADSINRQEAQLADEIKALAAEGDKDNAERRLIEQKHSETEKGIEEIKSKLADNAAEIRKTEVMLAENTEAHHKAELEGKELQNLKDTALMRLQQLEAAERLRNANREKLEADIKTFEMQVYALEQAKLVLENDIADLDRQGKEFEARTQTILEQRDAYEKRINEQRRAQRDMYDVREKLSREIEKQTTKFNGVTEERETLINKIWEEYELSLTDARTHTVEITDYAEAQKKVASVRASMKALGEVNPGAIEEFAEVKERYDHLTSQVEDLIKSREGLEKIIEELTNKMKEIFSEKFKVIGEEFEKVFKQLFNGGTAKLELETPDNILESGIDIYVAPPGKIIKHLSSLSGGEQSLTAIALYFAILTIRPAPFCLLDEIEAALDDVNVVRYAEYLHRHDRTQFIVITHRRGTMEAANRLYGVTMKEKGISRIIAIDVSEIEKHI